MWVAARCRLTPGERARTSVRGFVVSPKLVTLRFRLTWLVTRARRVRWPSSRCAFESRRLRRSRARSSICFQPVMGMAVSTRGRAVRGMRGRLVPSFRPRSTFAPAIAPAARCCFRCRGMCGSLPSPSLTAARRLRSGSSADQAIRRAANCHLRCPTLMADQGVPAEPDWMKKGHDSQRSPSQLTAHATDGGRRRPGVSESPSRRCRVHDPGIRPAPLARDMHTRRSAQRSGIWCS
jgi:hypothetical protein